VISSEFFVLHFEETAYFPGGKLSYEKATKGDKRRHF
jgi:hypothetical protein